jgi:THO complex subunit 4
LYRQPKGQPKPATVTKSSSNVDSARGRTARGRARGRRNVGRPKPKTADELDAEMADYWGPAGQTGVAGTNATSAANGASQPAATNGSGDVGMDDEGDVLVRPSRTVETILLLNVY